MKLNTLTSLARALTLDLRPNKLLSKIVVIIAILLAQDWLSKLKLE